MNEITWTCKHFKDLTNEELYEIFHLRMAVFVVEQNCPYQDADGKDLKGWHMMGISPSPARPVRRTPFGVGGLPKGKGEIVAYARILPAGISYHEPSIGRVITSASARRTGAGKKLMEKSIEFIKKEFGKAPIRIGAQLYLKKFYESFGFVREGEEYLEDGIPHIIMLFTP